MLFPDEPTPPGAGQLAAVLSGLFRASRQSGEPQVHVLSHGLQLTVGTAKGDVIGLSRKAGEPSPEEAHVTAAHAGWREYASEWRTVRGVRMLLIRPHTEAPAGPAPDTDPPDARIRELLLDPSAPWWHASLSPWMRELRAAAVQAMTRDELRTEYAWLGRHHAEGLRALTRARLAASLA